MGDLGLQGRDRRPRGRGCLLLAVAGATALVTLLLAVPVTVLAVLALVPQEQGGPVSGCSGPRGPGPGNAPDSCAFSLPGSAGGLYPVEGTSVSPRCPGASNPLPGWLSALP